MLVPGALNDTRTMRKAGGDISASPTSPFGASSGLEAVFSHISQIPTSPIPLGERFTSPLPVSVDPSPRTLDLGGPPLAAQSPSRSDPKIHYFFDRFLKPFRFHVCSQNGPQNLPKSSKNHSKNNFGQRNVNFWKIARRLHQKLIFEGPGSQKPSKHHEQTVPKLIKNRTKMWIDFWMIF